MDVRCPACAVEYEFDDDKVSPAGVTVKCTSCNHVFKVKKDGAAPALDLPAARTSNEWMVRQRDGRIFKFKELTTLQKWIVEQKVSREDHISRTGQQWKLLGDIAELASFFQVVDAARAAQQMAAQPAGYSSRPPGPPAGNLPQSPQPHLPTFTPGEPSPLANMPQSYLSSSQGAQATGHAAGSVGQATGSYPAGHRPTLETVFNPEAMSMGDYDEDLEDDDPVIQWQRRSRRRRMAFALVLVLTTGSGLVYALRPDVVQMAVAKFKALTGNQPPPPELVRAREALAKGKTELQTALEGLAPLVAAEQPEALALSSRLWTARARQLEWKHFVSEFRRLQGPPPTRMKTPAEAGAFLSKAYELAGKAMAKGAREARLASADYQAARGALAEMEADLSAEKGASGVEVAVVRVLGRARRSMDERTAGALDDVTTAMAAPGLPPEDQRLLTAVVIAKLAAGRDAKSMAADLQALRVVEGVGGIATDVDMVLTKRPDEPPPKKPENEEEAEAQPLEPGNANEPTVEQKASTAAAASPPKSSSYASLMARGKKALMAGRTSSALKLFKKAEAQRPRSPDAISGIGWAYLDAGKMSASIRAFKKSLAKDRGWADAHLGLGEAYRAQGNKTAAVKHFKKYLVLKPNGEEASVARRALKSLQ